MIIITKTNNIVLNIHPIPALNVSKKLSCLSLAIRPINNIDKKICISFFMTSNLKHKDK